MWEFVYNDSGIPSGSVVWVRSDPPTGDSRNGDYTREAPPEGTKCFQTFATDWADWGGYLQGSGIQESEVMITSILDEVNRRYKEISGWGCTIKFHRLFYG